MDRSMIKPQRLKGFHDYLPDIAKLRIDIIRVCQDVAIRSGFLPTRVPSMEYAEVLLGQGGETDKQVYRFLDNGERDVALRYDMTVPFARYVAEHFGEMTFPFKRCEAGQVFRAEKPQKGRLREFGQCDVDIIGVDSLAADCEVLLCLAQTLEEINFGGFTMVLNHRDLLSGLVRHFGPDQKTQSETEQAQFETQALIVIDKLDKIGIDGVNQQLHEQLHFTEQGAANLLALLKEDFSALKKNQTFNEILEKEPQAQKGFAHLVKLLNLLEQSHLGPSAKFVVNLSVARGLAYYTGLVFETTIDRLPHYGSVCSGGRYNNLAERFSKQLLPGVGGSIGTDRLLEAIIEMHEVSGLVHPDVYIAVATEDAEAYAFELATRLRQMHLITDINVAPGKKLGNQIRYAVKAGAKAAIIVGSDEVKTQTYVVKNLAQETELSGLNFEKMIDALKVVLSHCDGHGGCGGAGSGGGCGGGGGCHA